MRTAEHGILGALVALANECIYKKRKGETMTIGDAIKSLVIGGIAGAAPDIIEPATNPNHRSFFHSIAFFAILAHANNKIWQSESLTDEQKQLISTICAAYGSHLLIDGTSKRGLPLLF